MGRLREDFIERIEAFSHRVADVADALDADKRSNRIVNQIMASGTSVGANVAEADEALSRADFCKCLGIALKELAESRFWLRFIQKRRWLSPKRLDPLLEESAELRKILGTMLKNSKPPLTA